MAAHVLAAALYPTTADAREALKTTAHYTATGFSYSSAEPYRKLWQVDRTVAKGDLVVMDLTPKTAGSVSRALITSDFPLFWSP